MKENMTQVREHVVKFLYQCETERLYYFSHAHLEAYLKNFVVDANHRQSIALLCQGTLNQLDELDQLLEKFTKNWSLARMATTDRCVLRLAAYELSKTETPTKVVLNEAIELAKLYGTEQSFKFVNGLLDRLAKNLR